MLPKHEAYWYMGKEDVSSKLTHRSVLPAKSMEDPSGNIDPILVHGPLIDDELA